MTLRAKDYCNCVRASMLRGALEEAEYMLSPGPGRPTDEYQIRETLCILRRALGADAAVEMDETGRLCAAAPELLNALVELCELPNKKRPERVWERARAAIAKAKGGE